ncbi:hypothetical protein HYPSUDRAFT_94829, partial [Hypholoma sublateritium FD-334 SS-4]
DALDEWLADPVVSTNLDPIAYWTGMQAAGHPLSSMALDFLSIPGTSTDVERSFSKGGLTVSRFRHSLSDESTRYLSVVGMWHKIPGIIPRDSVIALFNE